MRCVCGRREDHAAGLIILCVVNFSGYLNGIVSCRQAFGGKTAVKENCQQCEGRQAKAWSNCHKRPCRQCGASTVLGQFCRHIITLKATADKFHTGFPISFLAHDRRRPFSRFSSWSTDLQVHFPVRLPFFFGTAGALMPFRAADAPFLPDARTPFPWLLVF